MPDLTFPNTQTQHNKTTSFTGWLGCKDNILNNYNNVITKLSDLVIYSQPAQEI